MIATSRVKRGSRETVAGCRKVFRGWPGVRSVWENSMIGLLLTIPNLVGLAAMILVSRSSDHRLERRYHVAIPAIMAGTALVLLPRKARAPAKGGSLASGRLLFHNDA